MSHALRTYFALKNAGRLLFWDGLLHEIIGGGVE